MISRIEITIKPGTTRKEAIEIAIKLRDIHGIPILVNFKSYSVEKFTITMTDTVESCWNDWDICRE
jgi:hypothetical protein